VVNCSDSSDLDRIESNVRAALGGEFKAAVRQHVPIGILMRETRRLLDPILTRDIRCPGEIEQALGEPWPPTAGQTRGYFDR
jgi:hypothetical protein